MWQRLLCGLKVFLAENKCTCSDGKCINSFMRRFEYVWTVLIRMRIV